jgi:hypothetical protein
MRRLLVLVALLLMPASSARAETAGRGLPSASQLALDRLTFQSEARRGVAQARRWFWNTRLGWYDDRLDDSWNPHMPLARL